MSPELSPPKLLLTHKVWRWMDNLGFLSNIHVLMFSLQLHSGEVGVGQRHETMFMSGIFSSMSDLVNDFPSLMHPQHVGASTSNCKREQQQKCHWVSGHTLVRSLWRSDHKSMQLCGCSSHFHSQAGLKRLITQRLNDTFAATPFTLLLCYSRSTLQGSERPWMISSVAIDTGLFVTLGINLVSVLCRSLRLHLNPMVYRISKESNPCQNLQSGLKRDSHPIWLSYDLHVRD